MFLSLVTIVLFSTAMMSLSLQQSTDNKVVENKFNTVMNIVSDAVTSVLSATWQLIGGDIDGEDQNNRSGSSVSLSGDGYTLAIGAIGNSANGNNSGHVRVYQYDGTDWFQKGGDIDGDAAFDQFGFSVSLSSDGNIVAIGATGNDGNGSNSGHVRIYTTAIPIIIETPHKYYSNMNEKWSVNIPGATCYTVTMDPQSWTANKNDFVRIFKVSNEVRTPFRQTQKRLYKKRLSEFPETVISADSLEIEFKSDAWGNNWGFRAYITECD